MIELSLLGPVQLRGTDGRELSAVLAQPKRLALLVYLAAARPRGFHRRDKLIGLFWPEFDQARARQGLSKAVHVLRRGLGEAAIVSRGDDELAIDDTLFSCDVRAFDADLASGDLRAALARYRGDFADGLYVDDAAEFERWLSLERERTRQAASKAAGELAESAAPGSAVSVELARQALDLSRHDEIALRRLMLALRHSGDRAGAARAYDDFARGLSADLDLAPSHATQSLRTALSAPDSLRAVASRAAAHDWADAAPASAEPSELAAATTSPIERRAATSSGAARRRSPLFAIAAIVLVVAGLVLAWRPNSTPPAAATDPHRLLVLALENRTADSTLDQLGAMTSDWMTQGIVAANLVSVTTGPSQPGTARGATLRDLASQSGAGLVLTGAYYEWDDSVEFQVRLWSASDNAVRQAFRPVLVPKRGVAAALDSLRQQALTAVAMAVSPERASSLLRGSPRAPAYDAYRDYAQGIDLFAERDFAGAYDHFARAARIDTSFATAALAAATTLMYSDPTSPVLDSIFTALSTRSGSLSETSRLWMSEMQAARRGDTPESTRLLGELARIAPASLFPYIYAQSLEALGRIREASVALRSMKTSGGSTRGFYAYWVSAGMFDDMLRDEAAARADVRDAVREYPRRLPIASAAARYFASTGRLEEADSVLDDAVAMIPQPGWDAGSVIAVAALEAAAHGHAEWVPRARARGLAWYNALAPAEREREIPGFGFTWFLYSIRAWPELDARVARLSRESPKDVRWIAYRGLIAARAGDASAARNVDKTLAAIADTTVSKPGLVSFALLSRARIAAMLGDRDAAVDLLRRSFASGGGYSAYVHTDPAFSGIRDYPPFAQLIAPR